MSLAYTRRVRVEPVKAKAQQQHRLRCSTLRWTQPTVVNLPYIVCWFIVSPVRSKKLDSPVLVALATYLSHRLAGSVGCRLPPIASADSDTPNMAI